MHLRMSAASWALFRLTTGCSWRGMCTGCLRDGIERWVWQRQAMARRRYDVSPQCRVCKQRMQAMNGEGGEQMGSPALEGSRFPFKKARGAPCKNPFGISGTRQNEFAQVRKLLRRLPSLSTSYTMLLWSIGSNTGTCRYHTHAHCSMSEYGANSSNRTTDKSLTRTLPSASNTASLQGKSVKVMSGLLNQSMHGKNALT